MAPTPPTPIAPALLAAELAAQAETARQASPVPSPCRNICRMDPASGYCEGCLRTIEEIAGWSCAGDEDKRRIWRSCRRAPHGWQARRPPLERSPVPQLPATMRVFERGWLSANNILFMEGDDTVLVDTGYVTHAPQTVALVAAALQGRPLARILNTHLHSDHCGGNAALQARWRPHTAIPAAEADAVAAWDTEALSYLATGQHCDRFTFDSVLQDGDTLRLGGLDWQVVAAPGHDPHAVMLFAPAERILISGDVLWENGFGVIFPELEGESGFAEQAAVLERIAQLDARQVIPGHGRRFTDVAAAVERAQGRLTYLSATRRAMPAMRSRCW